LNVPEFNPGDRVIIQAPDGNPPWPSGPVEVVACVFFDPDTCVGEYVVEHPSGLREKIHGAELLSLDEKLTNMQRYAN
jgi:hypothetical protein